MHTINLYNHTFPEGCSSAIDAINQAENEILAIHHHTKNLHHSVTALNGFAMLSNTVLELPSPYHTYSSNEACYKEWVHDYYNILMQALGLQDVAIPEGGLHLTFEGGYCLISRLGSLLTITTLINNED